MSLCVTRWCSRRRSRSTGPNAQDERLGDARRHVERSIAASAQYVERARRR